MVEGNSVFRVKIRQLSPAKRSKVSVTDSGDFLDSNASQCPTMAELKTQRVTEIFSPTKTISTTKQQSDPIVGTSVCF